MTTTPKKQQSLFPSVPTNPYVVDPETGMMKPDWLLFFQQFAQAAQENFQKEGVRAPSQDAANIADIKDQENIIGNIIYDSDNKVFKGVILNTESPLTTTTKEFQFV